MFQVWDVTAILFFFKTRLGEDMFHVRVWDMRKNRHLVFKTRKGEDMFQVRVWT